jgi:hypothetical protein
VFPRFGEGMEKGDQKPAEKHKRRNLSERIFSNVRILFYIAANIADSQLTMFVFLGIMVIP